jgi:hypothetical protein
MNGKVAFPLSLAGVLCITVLSIASLCAADGLDGEVLKRVKAAVVFIRAQSGNVSLQGSGFFCDGGLVVTNAHVLGMKRAPNTPPATIKIVLNSGIPGKELEADAVLAGCDAETDLAFLKVTLDEERRPKSVPLAAGKDVLETMPVFIFGYPFGDALTSSQGNPAVTVGSASVSSLRLNEAGGLAALQINGDLNPGNSGGPIITKNGEVVAVSVAAILGTQIGFAIPCDKVGTDLNGRIKEVVISRPHRQDELYDFHVQLTMIDPLERTKSVLFYGWTEAHSNRTSVETTKIPMQTDGASGYGARQKIELKHIDGSWQADLKSVRIAAGQEYWFQIGCVNSAKPEEQLSAAAKSDLTEKAIELEGDSRSTKTAVATSAVKLESSTQLDAEGRQYLLVKSKIEKLQLPPNLLQLVSSPNGKVVYGIFSDIAVVKIFAPPSFEEVGEIPVPHNPVSIWCDEKRIIVACDESRVVTVLDAESRKPVTSTMLQDKADLTPVRIAGVASDGSIMSLWRVKRKNGMGDFYNTSLYNIDQQGNARFIAKTGIDWCVLTNRRSCLLAQQTFGYMPSGSPQFTDLETGKSIDLKLFPFPGFHNNFAHCFQSFDHRKVILPTRKIGVDYGYPDWTYVATDDMSRFVFDFPGIAVAEAPKENLLVSWGNVYVRGHGPNPVPFVFYVNSFSGQILRRVEVSGLDEHPDFFLSVRATPSVTYIPGHELLVSIDPQDREKVRMIRCGPVEHPIPALGVMIMNDPPTVAHIGEKYSFLPEFSGQGETKVVFKLKKPLEGMTINAGTGKIEWDPLDLYIGKYELTMIVEMVGQNIPVLSWTLEICPALQKPVAPTPEQRADTSKIVDFQPYECVEKRDDRGRRFASLTADAYQAKLPDGLIQMIPAPSGKVLFGIVSGSAVVKVLEPTSLKQIDEFSVPRYPISLWCEDKQLFVACNESRVITVVDSESRNPIRSLRLKDGPNFIPLRVVGRAPGDAGIMTLWKAWGDAPTEISFYCINENGNVGSESVRGIIDDCMMIKNGTQLFAQPAAPYALGTPTIFDLATGSSSNFASPILANQRIFGRCFMTYDHRRCLLSTDRNSVGQGIRTYVFDNSLSRLVFDFPGAAVAEIEKDNAFVSMGSEFDGTQNRFVYYTSRTSGRLLRKIQINSKKYPNPLIVAPERRAIFVPGHELLIYFDSNDRANGNLVRCGPIKNVLQNVSVSIVNDPSAIAKVGRQFTFQPEVKADKEARIKYKVKKMPDGMAIDEKNGTLTWKPSKAQIGKYDLEIVADVDEDVIPLLSCTLEVQP